ncbi:Uncharacterized protein Adt_06238 [Abeliophyllum distichum]|uniref:Uncharacterized protein n=1 Tax=Abeliophyllum distichum TaxID=126358 RepID=A0ABD1V6C5_9LAMI
MNALKKAVLAYTSFMDKDISRASAASQNKLVTHLSEDLDDVFQRHTFELPADIRLTLRGIHQQPLTLNELSSEVVIEDSMFMSLETEMMDIRVKSDDCNMRLAAKKHNASLEIEQTRDLMARYSKVTVDDHDLVMEELSTVDTLQHSEWSKLHYQMRSILERLDVAGQ